MNMKADHTGHRERLKERFCREGLVNFEVHNALELLLFYAIPYKDTNEIAHLLLDRFGSLRNVLDAPIAELVKVEGIGLHSAVLIKLFTEVERRSRKEFNESIHVIDSTEKAKQFCENLFYGRVNESMEIICLDNANHLIHHETVALGTVNRSHVDVRLLLEAVVRHNSASVILTHNHPRGECKVSAEDLNFTMELKMLLSNIGVKLEDHIIVGEWSAFSMAQQDALKAMF